MSNRKVFVTESRSTDNCLWPGVYEWVHEEKYLGYIEPHYILPNFGTSKQGKLFFERLVIEEPSLFWKRITCKSAMRSKTVFEERGDLVTFNHGLLSIFRDIDYILVENKEYQIGKLSWTNVGHPGMPPYKKADYRNIKFLHDISNI